MLNSDRKIVQDRAIWPISARAATRQIFERLAHRSELVLLALHLRGSCKREGLDLTTRPIAVLPQRDELADLRNWKAQIACAADEAQHVDFAFVIVAVAGITPRGLRNEADRLIMADHPLADARSFGSLSYIHVLSPQAAVGRQRRSVSALAATLTLDSAIAAPAITGLR